MATAKKWYVEVDAHTNAVVAGDLPAENAHQGVLCQDGKKRDLWECTYQYISKLLENEVVSHLQFKVFYREGQLGPVKKWPFARRRKVSMAIFRRASGRRPKGARSKSMGLSWG